MPAFIEGPDRRSTSEAFDHFLRIDEIVIHVDDNGNRNVCRWHRNFDLGIVVKIRIEQDAGQAKVRGQDASHAIGPIAAQGYADDECFGMRGDVVS